MLKKEKYIIEIPYYFNKENLTYNVTNTNMKIKDYFSKIFYYYCDLIYYMFDYPNLYLFSICPSIYFNLKKKVQGICDKEVYFNTLEEIFHFFYIINLVGITIDFDTFVNQKNFDSFFIHYNIIPKKDILKIMKNEILNKIENNKRLFY